MRGNTFLTFLSIFLLVVISELPPAAFAQAKYPSTFLWGAAMSAHQIEGLTRGGQNADWYPFEHTPGNIYGNQNADIATDHWHQYPADLSHSIRSTVWSPQFISSFPTELGHLPNLVVPPALAGFIVGTLHYLDLATFGHDGLPPMDVRGYYRWSLTDDFEWQWGYFRRYGLNQILYDQNLERVPRPSATVYCQQILDRLSVPGTVRNCSQP